MAENAIFARFNDSQFELAVNQAIGICQRLYWIAHLQITDVETEFGVKT